MVSDVMINHSFQNKNIFGNAAILYKLKPYEIVLQFAIIFFLQNVYKI